MSTARDRFGGVLLAAHLGSEFFVVIYLSGEGLGSQDRLKVGDALNHLPS